jgi:polysaccharide export outer membrane protein
VVRSPATGNETVLDAVAQIGGLSKETARKVWVARRGPGEVEQILPVDWTDITQRGHTRTNYQLLPSDRVFVKKAD